MERNNLRRDRFAEVQALREAAYAEAMALRREAIADFWRGANAMLGHAAIGVRRSAERLAQRLRRRASAA